MMSYADAATALCSTQDERTVDIATVGALQEGRGHVMLI